MELGVLYAKNHYKLLMHEEGGVPLNTVGDADETANDSNVAKAREHFNV